MIKQKFFEPNVLRKLFCTAACICMCTLSLHAQSVSVRGTVTDANGEGLPGVNISVKGSTTGVISDAGGNYNITVAGENPVLVFSYIGFARQEIKVGGRTTLNVALAEDTQALDEVVVVGYGTQKKVNLSGAVSTISAKSLANRTVTNANIALQGLAPNMNITRGSGVSTDAPGINIRGFTSINGGEAFILVDNVPTTAEEFARINPADIENISVLKDASSAAIYGARASFGVVLVTTKTAKSDKIQIDADYTYGLRQFANIPELVTDIPTYMEMANIMSSDPNRFNDAAIEYARRRMTDRSLPEILGPGRENGGINDRQINSGEWEYYGVYDWFDVMLKDLSPNQTANVRISQRTEKLDYSVSGGIFSEGGMLNFGNEDYKRFNFRVNGTYRLTDRWTVGTNSTFNRQAFDESIGAGEGQFWFFRLHSNYPTQPIYNPDGTYTQDGGQNVASAVSGARIKQTGDETQLSFNTKYYILKDVWSVSGDATFRMYNEDKNRVNIPTTYQNKPGKPRGVGDNSVVVNRNLNRRTVYNLYSNFDKMFAEKHFVSATVGYNQEYYVYNNLEVSGRKLITESVPSLQLTQSDLSRSMSNEEEALRGVFGRINYIFDNKYILEANGRYDGSSRFSKGDRFGFFPSYSAAWILSRERFMESAGESLRLSNLKLRGSLGTLGNQVIKSGNTQIYYPTVADMSLKNQIDIPIDGSRPQAMNPPGATVGSLTWETVRTVNGGIDLGFLNDRLDASFDIYTRYTENMLTYSKELPTVFGTGAPRANAADLKTKGWELNLGWRDAVNVGGSPLSYSLRFMLADNQTWITRFDNPDRNLGDHYVGRKLGDIWGYTTIGYFESDEEAASWADQSALNSTGFKAGDMKFADLNGDGKINTGSDRVDDPGDRTIIGNDRERLPYSIDLGADWKGFDLRLFFQGIGKRDVYPPASGEGFFFWGMYNTAWCNPNTKNLDHWTPENPDAYFPRLKPGANTSVGIAFTGELSAKQTKYLQDASYMRLKNMTLGYTVPSKLLQKAKIRSLRVYVSGENLLTFHHIEVKGNDPEKFGSGIYYPFQRTFAFGLNLGF